MDIKLLKHALQETILQVLQEKFKQEVKGNQKHWQNTLCFQIWKVDSWVSMTESDVVCFEKVGFSKST